MSPTIVTPTFTKMPYPTDPQQADGPRAFQDDSTIAQADFAKVGAWSSSFLDANRATVYEGSAFFTPTVSWAFYGTYTWAMVQNNVLVFSMALNYNLSEDMGFNLPITIGTIKPGFFPAVRYVEAYGETFEDATSPVGVQRVSATVGYPNASGTVTIREMSQVWDYWYVFAFRTRFYLSGSYHLQKTT